MTPKFHQSLLDAFVTLAVLMPLTAGCGGDSSFKGSGAQTAKTDDAKPVDPAAPPPAPAPTPEPTPPPLANYTALTWFWQCDSDPAAVPNAPNATSSVLQGVGPHHFTPAQVEGSSITITGRLCKPATLKRDIIFVVDTSGSMEDNDARVGNGCGRLTAIRQVLLAIAGEGVGTANFGIVTFNSTLDRNSTRLFDNASLLFAELAGTADISAVVCNAVGGTNYDDGLAKAADLLSAGRVGATKEIYFISDGQPDDGKDGAARAATLKTVGVPVGTQQVPVTIATVMLAGTDKVLETKIASRDSTGKALHAYVTQTGGLAKVLADLAHNEIVGAELKYRSVDATSWTSLDLLTHMDAQFNFTIPSFKIEVSKEPRGIEVQYEYWDKHDNRFSTGGKVLWTVDASNTGS